MSATTAQPAGSVQRELELVAATVGHLDEVYMAGEWIAGDGGTYDVVSPSTEEVIASVSLPSLAQADRAIQLAHDLGQQSWSRVPVAERVEAVRRFCVAMEARFSQIAVAWALEAGAPVRYSKTLHRYAAAGAWQTALDCAVEALADVRRATPLGEVIVRREPVGVVVGVMAYNGPVVTVASKVIPALLAGCPVVVKAAPESQLVMRLLADCADEAGFPAGTLTLFAGDIDLGRRLTAHEQTDLVSLTGGTRAAQEIIDATRNRFARTHLELGGKSPALILEDAPVAETLRTLVAGATGGTGQLCALLSRILIPRSQWDEWLGALTEAWSKINVGDPLAPETLVGPLANAAARDRTESFVATARTEGATVASGGRRPPDLPTGYYYEPTLLVDVHRDSTLATTEVFGPATAVIAYDDLDDGIALANATTYGLAASVYTADREKAWYCAERIESGSVALNAWGPSVAAPYGGRKHSGWGREGGPEGIHEFTELKQILLGPGLAN